MAVHVPRISPFVKRAPTTYSMTIIARNTSTPAHRPAAFQGAYLPSFTAMMIQQRWYREIGSSASWDSDAGRVDGRATPKEKLKLKDTESRMYTFEQIQAHVESLLSSSSSQTQSTPSAPFPVSSHPLLHLIDTREPSELYQTGTIPSSKNIPVLSRPDAFFLPAEEFEESFGFVRPDAGEPVVFFCQAGVRCRTAAELARKAGWCHVAEFRGSWREWVEKGGRVEKVE